MEFVLKEIINIFIVVLEMIGVLIIIIAALRAFINLAKYKLDFTRSAMKIEFAMGLALALEFKLAAEILKTVVVSTLDEFIIVAAVTLLRMLISYLIHWEVKNQKEKYNGHEENEIENKEIK